MTRPLPRGGTRLLSRVTTRRAPLRDAALIAGTGLRLLAEDPLHALVQASRRLPTRVRRLLAADRRRGDRGPTLWGALAAWLADHPDQAAEILARLEPAPPDRTGPAARLRELLAVTLGAWSDPDALSSAAGRARAKWQVGALSDAAAEVAGTDSALARRLESELRMLTPGVRVTLRTPTPVPDGRGVLMCLTNCLPWTRSGYTARSQAILTALAERGVPVTAVTRIGYPVTVGLAARAVVHRVGPVPYHRLAVARLEPALDARAGQQADLVRGLARRVRPAVLHTTTDYTNAVATRAVAEATGLPWVYEMRGMLELTWVAARPPHLRDRAADSERVRLLRAREAELARAADAVVCLSRVQADDLIARGVPAASILVSPNAVAADLLRRDPVTPAAARERLGLPRAGLWVGTVTSMVDYEGLDTLLDAVALARAAGRDVRAALVGDGVSRPGLVRRVHESGLADVVVLPGRVPGAEAILWHEALDVFAVPRRDTPVCRMVTPLKPMEAMALGRPVLASDLPALAEVLGSPTAGLLLPAGDASAWASAFDAAGDAAWRAAAGERGRAHAARHTWARVAAGYADLYQRLREDS